MFATAEPRHDAASDTAASRHETVWLHHAGQRLGLVPSLGGGVAAWQLERPEGLLDLWRPWDGRTEDRYTLASFAMVPWSNRISAGGFEHNGKFHPMEPNREGEPYPIHGDGWLQPWTFTQRRCDTIEMSLESHGHGGNPYDYHAVQTFTLVDGGLDQSVQVTHMGRQPLPYGLGLHPWFPRTPGTRLTAPVRGVWLSGDDPIPTRHTEDFPATWDLRDEADVNGSLIDNAYSGWPGEALIRWPERGLEMTMVVTSLQRYCAEGHCLLYRPPHGESFCFEPVTHPIDAFHLPGRPGLESLRMGDSLSLTVQWRVRPTAGG